MSRCFTFDVSAGFQHAKNGPLDETGGIVILSIIARARIEDNRARAEECEKNASMRGMSQACFQVSPLQGRTLTP